MIALPIFTCSVVCVLILYFQFLKRIRNYPPGPLGWPIFGNLLQLRPNQFEAYSNLRKQYGDIFSVNLGSLRSVVLNDYKLIKEVFIKSEFYGRPLCSLSFATNGGRLAGFGFSEGSVWFEQRRFLIKHLRDFGFGSKSSDASLQRDALEAITALKSKTGVPINLYIEFEAATMNCTWEMATGERFSRSDPEFIKLRKSISENLQDGDTFFTSMRFSWLKYLGLNKPRTFIKNTAYLNSIIRKRAMEHEKSFNTEVHRDLIDCYLNKIRNTTDPKSSFYKSAGEANMIFSLSDIIYSGIETNAVALSWIALTMAYFPEKQEKLYQEIKAVVGLQNSPSLMDKSRMPYTQAVFMEVLRYTRFVPQTFRKALEDVKVNDYIIPKGTAIFANFAEIMKDPNVWGDPENFRPERFLSEDGTEIIRNEAFIFFSVGKRACPGESFSRDQLFIFTASIFQHFRVVLENNNFTFKGSDGVLTMYPKHNKLVLYNRQESG